MTHEIVKLLKQIKTLREAAVALFRDGYTGIEIVRNKDRLNELHKPSPDWISISQSSLNRWINSAKNEDSDLEIWHLLNRRRRRPGMYTNWQPNGVVILGPHQDPLEVEASGNSGTPTVNRVPSKFVPIGPKLRKRIKKTSYSISDSDAVGIYLAELSERGYSVRGIVTLWKTGRTRSPDKDKTRRVQWLIRQIKAVRETPMSYSTVWRILQMYSFGPVAESLKQTQMAGIGVSDE